MTKTITVYRADERPYEPGEVIAGNREDHIGTMQGGHLLAEQLVRAAHPHGADLRANYLYVFRDYEWARRYWELRGPRYFYEATVHPDDALHVGDMDIFNQIAVADNQQRGEFIRQYWEGVESTDNKKIELIVRRATVLRVLGTPDDQVAARRRLVGGGV